MKKALPEAGLLALCMLFLSMMIAGNSFAQITQRGTVVNNTSVAATITLNKPTGVMPGDVMLVNITQTDNDNATLGNASLAGWTVIDGRLIYDEGNFGGAQAWWGTILYRVVDGTEGSSFTFTLDADATEGNAGSIVAFYNVNVTGGVTEAGAAGGPFDVDPGIINVAGAASLTATITGITTATANAGVVMLVHSADNITYSNWNTTSPGVLTEIAENSFNSTSDPAEGIAWAVKATAGATGNGTVAQSLSVRWGGLMLALKPCVAPVISGTLTVCAGSTTQLSGSGTPAGSLPWKSSNTGVATVDNNGLVSGVAAGTTIITYTNNLGCLATATVTVNALPTITIGANPTVCQGVTTANLTYSATTGSPNQYSIDYDFGAELSGFVDVVNATLPASPIALVVPGAVAAGTYNAVLTVRNSTTGCVSAGAAIAVNVNATPTVTPGTNPVVCRGTTSALLSYTETNSPNQYSINYDGAANTAGFVDVVNAALPVGNINIVIPGAVAAGVYNATLTVRNSTTTCTSSSVAITVTVLAPVVSFTGATTICVGSGTTLSPTTGGTWVSNNPSVATVDDGGNVTSVLPGTATFTFTETATGCSSTTGTLTVNGNSTLSFTSAVGTDAQTVCVNTAITNITYLVGGYGTGATVTGLPTGVTGTYNGGTKVFTISGTPSVAGSYNYTVTTTGPCINASLSGTIEVTATSSITLTSGVGTNIQTRCINTAITDITYAIGGTGTGANLTGSLPAGVTGSFDAGVFTITGVPTASGVFNYTVTSVGPCPASLTGTITVTADATLSLTSAVGTDAQTKCISTAITNITYLVGGSGTGATVSGLPTGVTGTYNGGSKVFTISGTPSVAGTFNYTVTTTGPCVKPALSGTITVTPNATISLSSGANSNLQTVCINSPITNISYTVGGSGTGANVSGLPAGLTSNFSAGEFTISGSPSAAGTFNFTVTTTGPCVNPSLTGTIIVNSLPSVTIAASPATICIGGTSTLTATNSGGSTSNTFSGTNSTSTAIPDWSASAYTYSTITLAAGANTLASTDLLQVTLNITHNNDADLDIFLVDPSGTRAILLSSDNGGTGNNYTNTVLSTAASNVIGSTGNNTAPFTGTFRPEGTITTAPDRTGNFSGGNYNAVVPALALNGAPITGAWSLRIFDDGFGTTGTLASWSLSITKPGAYSTVFNGPGSFGSVIPGGGSTNPSPSVVVTPPAGVSSYTATTTDAAGCQSTTVVPVDITVNPDATISLTTGNNNQAACFNSPTPISNIVYNIGGGGTGAGVTGLPAGVTGLYNAGVFTISGTPTVAGTFNYTVTTTGTCVQATATGTIIVNTPPTATYVRTNVSACGGVPDGTITVTPAGGSAPYNYSWSGMTDIGATVPFPDPGNVSAVTGLKIGYYNVTVTDAVGCQAAITGIHVQYAFSAFVTNNGSISSSCGNTGTIILYANAGVQPYSFSLDGVNFTSNNTFTNLAAGAYVAHVKDGAGCVITRNITVGAAAPLVASPFMRPASSCSNDGVIEIYRSGGISPYTYSMDGVNYQASNIYNGLSAGPYTVYVKDSKGCVASASVTVTQGAALNVTTTKTNASTCQNDGTIRVNATGGNSPYTYSINGGPYQSSNAFLGLAAGSYAVSVKDFKGCTGTTNVTINLNTINVTSFATAASSCAASDGVINLYRSGGVGPYTYSIDGNTYQSSSTFTGVAPGVYDGYVKDSKTCIGIMYSIVVGPEGCNPPIAGSSSKSAPVAKQITPAVEINSELKVNAYPNPANAQFRLSLQGNNNEKVIVMVTDLLGRKVYQAEGNIKQQYAFGQNFKAGMYLLQVVQGNQKQTIKLVKE